ncbi:MAG: hypothetical protein MK209_08775 [Planctomycetes bacterium]|nr:hypothetical protein [Planctomycetota bacterium]
MRPLHAIPLVAIAASCASTPNLPPTSYTIEDQGVGLTQSFRGANYGLGNRMWSSGTSATIFYCGTDEEDWVQTSLPIAGERDLRDIDIRLDGEVFAMAAGTGSHSALYFMEGVTSNWIEVLTNPDPEGFFDSLAFDEEGLGLLIGDPIGGNFTFFRSYNGRNWNRIEQTRCPTATKGEYAFAASGSILLATGPGEFWFATGGSRSQIWHTDSGGDAWLPTHAPEVGGSESRGWFGLGHSREGTLIAVGGDYTNPEHESTVAVLRPDAGEWEVTHMRGFRSAVLAVPNRPGHWVAVGSHGADWSSDDGLSWKPLPLSGGHALAPAGAGSVLVVGGPEQAHQIVRFGA